MNYLDNQKKFPRNILEPKIFVDEFSNEYTIYRFRFSGLQDLYDFLKSKPGINTDVFDKNNLSSIKGPSSFAGRPYSEAVEMLIEDKDPGYEEYLRFQKQINAYSTKVHKYKEVKSVAGGSLDVVAYATSSPEIYRVSRLVNQPKFVKLDIQISYDGFTTKNQIFNKAVIITNLIHALERSGYIVDVNSFEISNEDDEIVQTTFKIKNHGQLTNYQALYKTLVDVEFLRRICFRLNEICAVQNKGWLHSYGSPMKKEMAKKILKLSNNDYYFGSPDEMKISGYDIGLDFENVVEILGLDNVIDVEKEKNLIEKGVKVLEKSR